MLAAFLLFILGCGFLGSTHMIAIYVSPIMVPTIALSFPLLPLYCPRASFISHNLPQLLTHKDAHVFPRFEDHQRYSIVVATTSILLSLYSTYSPKRIPFIILCFYPSGIWQLVFEPMAVSVGLATPLQGSALFHAGLFGWAKNLVVLILVLPNHALLPQ